MADTQAQQPAKSAALPTGAKPVGDITERWEGYSPLDLRPGVSPENFQQFDQEDLLGKPITVYGYSERSGQFGSFMIVAFSPDGKQLCTFVTGGTVLLRKLKVCAEKNSWPVSGTLKKPDGKRYYDFVS